MMEVIDVKTEAKKYQTLQTRYRVIFASAIALFVGALTLIIVYSPENYALALGLSILLGTLFIWAFLYVVSGPYLAIAKRARFYRQAIQGLKSEEEVTIASLGGTEEVSKDGIPASLVTASFQENGKKYDRILYLLAPVPSLKVGERIRATSFASVLLSYEVLP
jgi:hypothetical protein